MIQAMSESTPQRQDGAGDHVRFRARCVLLHAPGRAAPRELLAALDRRSIDARPTADPYRALAWLVTTQADSGPVVLLISEPEHVPAACEMVRASERYAPRAVRWMFDPISNPSLRAVVESDVLAWRGGAEPDAGEPEDDAAPASQTTDEPAGTPALRLVDPPPTTPVGPGKPKAMAPDVLSDGAIDTQRVISDDELSMLMGDDGEEVS